MLRRNQSGHARQHNIDNTSDHAGVIGATEDNFSAFDANGLPKDSGYSQSDFAPAIHSHFEAEITDLDKYTQAEVNNFFIAHESTYNHTLLHDEATVAGLPLTLSGQEITFNYDTNHFQLDGNNLQLKETYLTDITGESISDLLDVDFDSGTPNDNDALIYDLASGKWKAEAIEGMKFFFEAKVNRAKLPSSNPAVIDGGENNWRLLFDDTIDENCYWQTAVRNYQGGTIKCDIYYTMASAITGSVVWELYVMAVTSGDSADINTDSYDTVNYVQDSVPGIAGYLKKVTITLSNLDSLADLDYVKFKLARDADGTNGIDNATGDAEVVAIVIYEE